MSDSHENYMRLALEEARIGMAEGEEPFGAVVVRQGTVIAKAHSLKVSSFDTTAHAETRAVGIATRFLKRRKARDRYPGIGMRCVIPGSPARSDQPLKTLYP